MSLRALRTLASLAVLGLAGAGCRPSSPPGPTVDDPNHPKAHEVGRELGEGTRRAGEAINQGVHKAGETLKSVGEGFKEGVDSNADAGTAPAR